MITDYKVLTLGHVVNYKNPEVWFQVAKRIKNTRNDVSFIWLGSGKLLDEYKEKTTQYDNISFLGYKDDLAHYYSQATIYFQPSKIESHGNSVVAAVAYGILCVV